MFEQAEEIPEGAGMSNISFHSLCSDVTPYHYPQTNSKSQHLLDVYCIPGSLLL